MRTFFIDGKEHYETKIVTLKGKQYQELKSIAPMFPYTKYTEIIVDGKLELINDWDIEYALRVKYAMCVLALHGVLIMDHCFMLDEDEFVIKNGKLVILNKEKRGTFDYMIKHFGIKKNN